MHRRILKKSRPTLTIPGQKARNPNTHPAALVPASLAPASRGLLILIAATLALAMLCGPAAAHDDFPKEWCGGADCRYAEPEELVVECGGIRVETEEFTQSTPFTQISRWNGPRPAICARNEKLNRCNPNKGDCSEQPGLGLLLPEADWEDLRKRAARACRDRGKEALTHGQSVPGLKLPSNTIIGGGPPVGGGGNSPIPPDITPAPVPGPAALGLLAMALGALGVAARRRK